MTSDDTINGYIREALELIIDDSSYLVIKADQNSPRNKNPYCTVKIVSSRQQSLEDFSYEDSGEYDSKISTSAMRSIKVAFNFFKNGEDSHDPFYNAGLCRQALNRISIGEKLTSDGLGLATRGQVKNLTFELDNGFEERAYFMASFNYVDTDSEILGTIGSAEVSGEYEINGRTETLTI